MEKRKLGVEDVPQNILRKLAADARRQDVSLNDVCSQILCAHYEQECERTGKEFGGPPRTSGLRLRLPDSIYHLIRVEAASRPRVTMRGVVIEVLAAHYGIKPPDAHRRPRLKESHA